MTTPPAPTRPTLLLLTRPDCHLCEDFRAELEHAFPGRFHIQEACVDDRPEWRAKYGFEIPVLLDGRGAVLSKVRFDEAARQRIAALAP